MRRLLRWAGAAIAGFVAYRLLRRERPEEAGIEQEEPPRADERAEELRRRLQESKELEDERQAFEDGETAVDEADPDESPEARRRGVHERGRAAAEEMRAGPAEAAGSSEEQDPAARPGPGGE